MSLGFYSVYISILGLESIVRTMIYIKGLFAMVKHDKEKQEKDPMELLVAGMTTPFDQAQQRLSDNDSIAHSSNFFSCEILLLPDRSKNDKKKSSPRS